ncbi:MAG: ATP-binding protein [Thermoplasmata archaeon]
MSEVAATLEADIDIPDEWRAFTLLVHSQAKHPLDFVREGVHNSFDAGATHVRVYVERSPKGLPTSLRILDNGSGAPSAKGLDGDEAHVLLKPDARHSEWGEFGRPELEYIPKHAADSLKASAPRASTVGEFGIGLYTFWALGEKLSLTTRARRPNGKPTDCWQLVMSREERKTHYGPAPLEPEIRQTGTVVRIDGLREEALGLLKPERIVSWLSEQLRQRLQTLGQRATLTVGATGVPDQKVEPKRYAGQPWEPSGKPRKYNTPYGVLTVDLYLLGEASAAEAGVSVTSNGALGYRRINAIEQLNRYPWNTTKVLGNIEFPAGRPTPSHDRFLPGKELNGLIQKVLQITPDLERDLKALEEKHQLELDLKSRERLLKLFREAMSQLDPNEYTPFKSRGGRREGTAPEGAEAAEVKPEDAGQQPETILALDHVSIHPAVLYLLPGTTGDLRATAHDATGRVIHAGLNLEWFIEKGPYLVVFASDPRAQAVSLQSRGPVGRAAVGVRATQGLVEKSKVVDVEILTKFPRKKRNERAKSGIPNPEFKNVWPLESWRSRYDPTFSNIVVNTGHPDYRRAASSSTREREVYVLTAMSKELILFNHGQEPMASVLDRVVEVVPIVLRRL